MDTQKLRKAIYDFGYWASPSSTNSSDPCTVGDINKVISGLSKVLKTFVDELEKEE